MKRQEYCKKILERELKNGIKELNCTNEKTMKKIDGLKQEVGMANETKIGR